MAKILLLLLTLQSMWNVDAHLPTRLFKSGDVILGCLISVREKESYDKCGKFFEAGISRAESVIFAIDKINNSSMLDIKLGYDIRDYCDSPALAMQHAYDFSISIPGINHTHALVSETGNGEHTPLGNYSKPIAALIGPSDSGTALPLAGLLRVEHIPMISSSATSDELSGKLYTSFFRTIPPDIYQARAMADLIEHFNWSYVGAVVVDHSYGRYGIRALEQESYDRKSFCIAATEFLPRSGFENKLGLVISKLKSKTNIRVIVLWTTETLGKNFLKEAKKQGLTNRTWILSEALATYKAKAFFGEYLSPYDDYFGIQPKLWEDPEFADHMMAVTPSKSVQTKNIWWDFVWQEMFNCSAFGAHGFKTCGSDVKIYKALYEKLKSGFVTYQEDAFFAAAHALKMIFECKGDDCPQTKPYVKPEDVNKYLRLVDFKGKTGNIKFDENGDPIHALYEVVTFRTFQSGLPTQKTIIGKWTNGYRNKLDITDASINWAEGFIPSSVCKERCPVGHKQTETIRCCWQCMACGEGYVNPYIGANNCTKCPRNQKSDASREFCVDLPIINQSWGSPSVITFLILTIVGFLMTFFTIFVFFKYRDTPIVKASNRELSLMLLMGILFCFTLGLFHLVRPNDALCPIMEPWRYIVYTACVSTLLLKTMRIVELFEASSNVGRCVKFYVMHQKRQIATVFLINMVEVVLAIVWLILDRPHVYEDIKPGVNIFLLCRSHTNVIGQVLLLLMLLYLTSLSLFCIYYAFKGRNLPENFNETRYIGFSMYILLLSWLAYYPVAFTLEGWPYESVIACATTLLNSYGLLGCMFLPKVYIILRQPEKNTVEAVRANLRTARGMDNYTGRSITGHSSPATARV